MTQADLRKRVVAAVTPGESCCSQPSQKCPQLRSRARIGRRANRARCASLKDFPKHFVCARLDEMQ